MGELRAGGYVDRGDGEGWVLDDAPQPQPVADPRSEPVDPGRVPGEPQEPVRSGWVFVEPEQPAPAEPEPEEPEPNPEPQPEPEPERVESETAGQGEAVNADTGEVTVPGEPLPDLPDSAYPDDVEELPEPEPSQLSMPAQGDPKADWVDYVVDSGYRTRDEAEQMIKADLVELARKYAHESG
jgi:hypothetical protein